ncbi:hypothetical protein V5E97_05520 [Singulisphaera sp. Ch08]|uniref:Phospholipase C n=1 Tax=Singulisphaera sp. Ch08 TaxID=3120278 RepID=A0AAU7CJA1_9BACT
MRSRRFRLMVTLCVSTLVAVMVTVTPLASAWDSKKFAQQPVHPTHSYLTEWAIDQLKTEAPELNQFRSELVEGANQELHELPTSGTLHGIDLEAKRKQHKGTNEGCDDIEGWWQDALAAYKSGNKAQAYFLLGIMIHMVEDMGVPAHANKVYHQGNLKEFDNFEFLGILNWKPKFDDINRNDPAYPEPWKYYAFSQDWAHTDAPDYHDRDEFSKTWVLASKAEKRLFSNREGRTCHVVMWALRSASKVFKG